MYRCGACGEVSVPGHPQLRHVEYRSNGSILRETAVCAECLEDLQAGVSLELLREAFAEPVPVPTQHAGNGVSGWRAVRVR